MAETPLMKITSDADHILNRLRSATNASSDSELARLLGVSQQSISSARSKNKVPDSWVRIAAQRFNLSADWLYFGKGSPPDAAPELQATRETPQLPLDGQLPQAVRSYIEQVEARFATQLRAQELSAQREREALKASIEAKDETIREMRNHLETYKALLHQHRSGFSQMLPLQEDEESFFADSPDSDLSALSDEPSEVKDS